MNRCGIYLIVGMMCSALNVSAQEAASKPLYQRLLQGEDAKKAARLTQKSRELEFSDNYAEAIATAEEELLLRTNLQGKDHYETINASNRVVALQKIAALEAKQRQDWRLQQRAESDALQLEARQGLYAQTLPVWKKGLELRRNLLGEDHLDTANSYNAVAFNFHTRRIAVEAYPYFKKTLEIKLRVLGKDHPETANSYNNLAANLKDQGEVREALPLVQQGLEIRLRVLGEDHPDLAYSYNTLAVNLDLQGRCAEAQLYHRKALDINLRLLGEDDPLVAINYNNLAISLTEQGYVALAQPLLEKALDIRRRAFGEEHPSTAASYDTLGANLHQQGKYVEAQPLVSKALEIFRRVYGEDQIDTSIGYSRLATNLEAQGKPAEALPYFQKALGINLRLVGEDHSETANSYNNLALNLQALGKAIEAQPHAERALRIRRKVLGEEHPDTAMSYNNLGFNFSAQEKFVAAQAYYQKALEIELRVFGDAHLDTANSYSNLAANLSDQGMDAEAQPHYEKALDIRRRVLGEGHPLTGSNYSLLATSLNLQGKTAEAVAVLRRAVFSYEASRLTSATGLDRASLNWSNPRSFLALSIHAKEPMQAWNEIEYSLARGLLDQQANEQQNLSPNEEAEWTRDRARLVDTQPQVLVLATKPLRSAEEDTLLDTLLNDRRAAEERLMALAVVASKREVASSEAIQTALAADAALVCWVDEGEHHFACLVRHTGDPVWVRLPGTAPGDEWTKSEKELSSKLRTALAEDGLFAEISTLCQQLYKIRFAPLEKHLSGVKTLYVVPVHEMAGIPVEALTDKFTVSYVPSGTFLARLKDVDKPRGNSLLALADPIFTNSGSKPLVATALPPGGLLITFVAPGSAADQAKLQAGDVLLKYGGLELTSIEQLQQAIADNATAKSIPISVWRESADKPLMRNLNPGKLGVAIAQEPARDAIANRRKGDALHAALRGGDKAELPGTRIEANRIAKLFGNRASVLADSRASEQQLEMLRQSGELLKYRYLHFATHGEGNSVRAFESALILAQDNVLENALPKAGEPFINGQLSANEVLEFWKLDAELVTLSACETAIGKQGGGDGMLGFAQAFLTAGSRAVCLSLWKVDDAATMLLMDRFYQNLLGKRAGLEKPMGKAAALAEAKSWLRSLTTDEALQLTAGMTQGVVRGKGQAELPRVVIPKPADPTNAQNFKPFDQPQYWAAFILIGDPD